MIEKLFGNGSLNPYKGKGMDEKKKWRAILIGSIVAAVFFFSKALSYHPRVASAMDGVSNSFELTNLMDRRTKPCKIAIVSFCHGHLCDTFWERAKLNHAAYAEMHGYDYIAESDDIVHKGVPAEWNVFRIFRKWLPHYDFVFFIDPGSIIMNGDIRIEEQFNLDDNMNHDLFLSWAHDGPHGRSMLMRSTARMLDLSEKLFSMYGKTQFFAGPGGAVDYYIKKHNLQGVRFLKFRKFQSHGNDQGYQSPVWEHEMRYKDGDFIVRDGSCGFSMHDCKHSGIFEQFYSMLIDGRPMRSTEPPAEEEGPKCHSTTVDVASYRHAAMSLLRREASVKLLSSSRIGN